MLKKAAFTTVELIIVIVIVSILAVVVIAGSGGIARTRISVTANRVKGDIRYAREEACTRHMRTWVEFDAAGETYSLYVGDDKATRVLMTDPMTRGNYVVQLNTGDYSGVEMISANFDGKTTLEFDSMGTPYDWKSGPLAADGTITLTGGVIIVVVRGTGMVRISK